MSIFSKESKKGKDYIEGKYNVSCTDLKPSVSSEFLFSIYDKVCEEYNPPFVSKNMQVAVRTLKDSLKGQNGLLNIHPDDYCLVHIGYFDKNTASIFPCTIFEKYEISRLFSPIQEIMEDVNDEVSE